MSLVGRLTAYFALSQACSPAKPASALGQRQLVRVPEPELIHEEFREAAGSDVLARDSRFEANAIEYPLKGIDLFGCKFKT